jgi:hypothetical protein
MISVAWLRNVSMVSVPDAELWRLRGFVIVTLLFLFGSLAVLWLIGMLSVRTYVVVSFIWILAGSEVFAPASPESSWWRRLQWVKTVGWVALAFVLVERVMAVL